ncbi:MAG: ThiF family adenylyltransferase, partial [Hyphomonadaceae bacterium]|nr:ThiF family adenylyltransferase [Hyphomonadaceae bacterium]
MSQRLIARNPLLKQLRDEGYNVQAPDGYLVVRDVPYVNSARAVARGVLMMPLDLANDFVQPPKDHQAQFAGDVPCNADGTEIFGLAPSASAARAGEVTAKVNFSAKPIGTGKYKDIRHKVMSYLQRITEPVAAIDPTATARTFPLVIDDDPESVFHYVDTASSRAEIVGASKKLMLNSVAILGLGGTGGYILDLVAKTPVKKIHIFDGDGFDQHNAFRAPGAASGDDLAAKLKKVDYFHGIYSRMHEGIVPHPEFMSEEHL